MLSKKIKSNERMVLIENDEIIQTEQGTAKVLNAFFSDIVQKPKMFKKKKFLKN